MWILPVSENIRPCNWKGIESLTFFKYVIHIKQLTNKLYVTPCDWKTINDERTAF